MLPEAHRLTRSADFRICVRTGVRGGSSSLVAHLLLPQASETAGEPRVGLVVSRAVGNAVTRNRVARRLRHLVSGRLESLPAGTLLVLRARPEAAVASSERLAADLDRALATARRRAEPAS